MERNRRILRGAAEGVCAGVVALAVVAALVWQLGVELDPDGGAVLRVYLLYLVVNGVVFGVVLGLLVGERRVTLASVAAAICLFGAVVGLVAFTTNKFLLVFLPPAFASAGFGAFAMLVLVSTDHGRRELAAWTLGGYVASLLLTLAVATVAPATLAALDPVIVDAGEIAELSLDRSSLFAMFAFYPLHGPVTFPIAAAGYGAGLRAVGVGSSTAASEAEERDAESNEARE